MWHVSKSKDPLSVYLNSCFSWDWGLKWYLTLKKELRLLKSHLAATPATSLCLARRNLFPLSTSASWVHDIPLLSNASQSRVRLYEVIGPSSVEEGIWEGKGLFRMVLFQCQISTKASFLLYNSLLICPPMYSEVQDLLIFPPCPLAGSCTGCLSGWCSLYKMPMLLLFCSYSNQPGECYCDFAATDPLNAWSLAQKRQASSYTDHGTCEHSQMNYKNCEIVHRKGLGKSLCLQG